jgi:hypothetical protein
VTTTSGSDVDSRQGRLTALTTPRSAALAGVAFVLLFSASMVLLRMSIPEDPLAGTAFSDSARTCLGTALALMPIAGHHMPMVRRRGRPRATTSRRWSMPGS